MKVTRFPPGSDLIIVPAFVSGPNGTRARLEMVFDTGASLTVVAPAVLDRLGYNPRNAEGRTRIRSAIGEEPGYLIRVLRLRALGHEFGDFRVHAHDLPDGFGIDGLLGLDFLRRFNFEVRCNEGRVLLQRLPVRH